MNYFNLLYCHDKNYNIQTFVSINSLLNNSQNGIFRIFIIHEDPDSFKYFEEKLNESKKIESINIFKFEDNNYFFPNTEGKHVSKATYYRLFISDYLPHDLDSLIYVDSDVIAIKKIDDIFELNLKKLKFSKNIISACVETKKLGPDHDLFKNMKLEGSGYFNAGVMFIDYSKWKEKTSVDKFLKVLKKYSDKIIFWDQDVLNKYFDQSYDEIPEILNFRVYEPVNYEILDKEAVLLHYSGNVKPWTIQGGYKKFSKYYFNIYRELGLGNYHFVTNKPRLESLKILFKLLLSREIFNIDKKLNYIIYSIKAIYKGRS